MSFDFGLEGLINKWGMIYLFYGNFDIIWFKLMYLLDDYINFCY